MFDVFNIVNLFLFFLIKINFVRGFFFFFIVYMIFFILLILVKYRIFVKYEYFYRIIDDKVLSSLLVDYW